MNEMEISFGSGNGQVLEGRSKIGTMAFYTTINSELEKFWSRRKWKTYQKFLNKCQNAQWFIYSFFVDFSVSTKFE